MATRLTAVQGDTAIWRITIVDGDGAPLDLSSFDITFTIKRSTQDTDAAAVWQGTLADEDIALVGLATAGVIDVTVPVEALLAMRTGRLYYWDVQLEGYGGIRFTPDHGTILLDAEGAVTNG